MVIFSALFIIDLQAVKLIYGLRRNGTSNSSKELDAVWDITICLQFLSPSYSPLKDRYHCTLIKYQLMMNIVNPKDDWEFTLYKINVFLLNIVGVCIFITIPLSYQNLTEKADREFVQEKLLAITVFLLCLSYWTIVEIYGYLYKLKKAEPRIWKKAKQINWLKTLTGVKPEFPLKHKNKNNQRKSQLFS